MAATSLLFSLIVLVCVDKAFSWSGNVCSSVGCRYVTRRVCAYQTWAACCAWKTITEAEYYTIYFCCNGWTHNGNENCNIPVCNPPCSNGGTCITPGVCKCLVQYSGPRCDNSVCSHQYPCYPGTCIPPNSCTCDNGFANASSSLQDRCLKIQDVKVADLQIFQMQVRMSYWPRNMTPPMEKYGILADSTNLNGLIDFFWSNRKNFNNLQTTCSSQFNLAVNYPPPYVSNATFGIVSAYVVAVLSKLPSGSGSRYISLNQTLPCGRQANSRTPETRLFMCNISNPNFDRIIEHGDILQVTYKTAGGGFRSLLDLNTNTPYATQDFQGVESSLSVEFRFDFQPPTHCGENSINSCTNGNVMLNVTDVTRTNPLKIVWSGWEDSDSKMFRYSMEVFKMTKTSDGKLEIRNDKALDPLINREVMHAALGPQEYTLPGPGMYSVILEAADLANNTKYVRRLCLFDPDSQITVDSQQRLYVLAANPSTDYTYLNNGSAPIVVTWLRYFRNALHEDEALLGAVLSYPVQLEDGLKNIPFGTPREDHEGSRTVDSIGNERGITNFKVFYAKDHEGGRNQPITPPSWTDAVLNTSYTIPEKLSEGDTLTVWVKATDYVNNDLVQRIHVTLDSTPPQLQNANTGFRMNEIVPGVPFSSKFEIKVNDDESGIWYTQWTFKLTNGSIIYQQRQEGRQVSREECTDSSTCRCNPDGACFPYDQSFALSNCRMMVRKDNLQTERIFAIADITNRAGLVTTWNWTKTDLTQLNGTKEYYPPQNVRVSQVTADSVTITWTFPPSCFERTDVWVSVLLDGRETKTPVHPDATSYTLGGLSAGTQYRVVMVTRYEGDQTSDSESVIFTTETNGISGGAIAGIVIGLLILAALVVFIVLFVLWRKGKVMKKGRANRSMQTVSTVFDNIRKKTFRATHGGAFSNSAYKADEDEIYLYSSMTFGTRQNWQLQNDSLTLIDHIMEGKFANIYKASLRAASANKTTVVAKLLKNGFSQDDAQKMVAKINFFATQVDNHDNVIHFLGAVLENSAWGPVMVLEYCEGGQLDTWLTSYKGKVDEQVMDKLYQFCIGIAKGMEYLASKKIVHRRLAARNILLTFLHDVRVAGFGPQHKDGDQNGEAHQTRVPAKWAAPEVLADKIPTEKSDVWSFGIVLWEIFSMGDMPYREIRSQEIGSRLEGGYRMQKPEYSDDVHYRLMKECWEYKPSRRPAFKEIRGRLCQNFSPSRNSNDFYYDTNELHGGPKP